MLSRTMTALAALCFFSTVASADDPTKPNVYHIIPLTSNQPAVAPNQDPVLQNAWGIAFTPGASPFWVSDNMTGCSTLYDGLGVPAGGPPPLKVKIPLPGGQPSATSCQPVANDNVTNAAPTSVLWNPTNTFMLPGTQNTVAVFVFATEDGTISAWAPTQPDPSAAILTVDFSGATAVFKGATFGTNARGQFLYVADFRNAKIWVFAPNGAAPWVQATQQQIPGNFTDPNLPAGFAPFSIHNIEGSLWVTYAKQDAAKHDDVPGLGNGFVNIFDPDGNFLQRFASQGALNSPWAVVRAPWGLGRFAGDILVGNFGDGGLTAWDNTGKFIDYLRGANQQPVIIDGVWAIEQGGGRNSTSDSLYFAAGPDMEVNGLFGMIAPGAGMSTVGSGHGPKRKTH